MKVVLFCGGQGMRLREYSDRLPKPLVDVGQRPILWHLMRYYAHYGHSEFVLCLGYGAQESRSSSSATTSGSTNDFVLSAAASELELLEHRHRRLEDHVRRHRLRLERRRAAAAGPAGHLDDDEIFLANYADGLSDLAARRVRRHVRPDGTRPPASSAVPVPHTFHIVHTDGEGDVTGWSRSPHRRFASTPGSSSCAARSSTT